MPMRVCCTLMLLLLAGCGAFDSKPKDSASLTLNDPYWDRVNVELVLTKNGDCDARGDGFISSRELIMRKNKTEYIEVPNGAAVCWRHDRNPKDPQPGAWSGWTRATLFPGQAAEAEL
jgi:hypothetical protein